MSVVFDSFANLTKVTEELERLPQSARDLFGSRIGWAVSSFSWEKHEDWGNAGKWLCRWAALGADVSEDRLDKSRVVGRAVLCVDMFRDRKPGVSRPKLAHAEEALLTCAFIGGQKAKDREGYDPEYLMFDVNGWPIEPEPFVVHAGGRLLEYVEGKQGERPWAERSWLFTVPLERIDNPRTFRAQIADPFWHILANGPDEAFNAESCACSFPWGTKV